MSYTKFHGVENGPDKSNVHTRLNFTKKIVGGLSFEY